MRAGTVRRALVADLRPTWDASVADSIESACAGAGLVITVTCARTPLVTKACMASGGDVLISAIGADSVGKQELEPALVASAALAVADSREQCFERGELQHAVGAGLLAKSAVVEIGEWLAGADPAVRPPGLVLFDSTGVAVQDAKIAELALAAAPVAPASKL